jgi:hypothetical protein
VVVAEGPDANSEERVVMGSAFLDAEKLSL